MKHPILITFFLFLFLSAFCYGMQQSPFSKRTNTLLWLTDNLIIMSSRNRCCIKDPFSPELHFKLHNEFAHNIIVNKNKTKVGLACTNYFVVYDIEKRKKIWTYKVPYSDNYSATFSPTDQIIIFHKGNVFLGNKSLFLPFIEPDALFGISCNHSTQEIIYPSNNHTFTRKSLIDDTIIRHSRIIHNDDKQYIVYSAFYNPDSPHIALETYEKNSKSNEHPAQKIFLLNSTTHKISKVISKYDAQEETAYYHAQFLPHSSLIAILCTHSGMHFWDFIHNEEIWVGVLKKHLLMCKNTDQIVAFNPQGTHCSAIIKKKYFIKRLPLNELQILARKHIRFIYWALGSYLHNDNLLPTDIKHILIHNLHRIYNIKSSL